ncbi:pyridoxal phosphate-dependent aminotransferase [Mycoplasma sp. P36-A1]|uniref:pyridoxal phosphate-dependent aminotransferase n=1 Tax=Mycoplasma sp. P36-A1 TaxID=3252900 RepID=UPI003C2E341B
MKISKRIANIPESPVRKMDGIAKSVKDKGINILHLNIGDPDIKTPKAFWKAVNNFNEDILGYSSTEGEKELIDAMVKYYDRFNLNFKFEDIVVTVGGSEALSMVLSSVADANDEVIVFEPYYTNYNSFFDICEVVPNAITTSSENGFRLPSKEEIVAKINDKTKAILFSNPGNPTGTVYTKKELLMLGEIAREHDLYIISDEVYREFVYDGVEYYSPASFKEMDQHTIIIDSISKRYSACGARIGNIACKNKEFMTQLKKIAQARLCVATLDQVGATALYNMDQSILTDIKNEYKNRRDFLFNELDNHDGMKFVKPQGAFYLVLDLPVKNAEHFVTWLLSEFSVNKETVMLTPAQGFYASNLGINQVRIAYILDCDKLARASKIIKDGLVEYKKKYE